MSTIFSKDDYNSDMGMSTLIWGPIQWNFLHIMSFNYPTNPSEKDKDNYHNYLMSLKFILPCKSCRDNYVKNLKMAKYGRNKLKNRDTFSRFMYDLHNIINKMLGKSNYMTYEYVRDRYEMFRAKCINNTPINPRFETGCTKPVNKIKSQCIINIVPLKQNQETFIIDKKCMPKKSSKKK